MATRIAVMHQGRLVQTGPPAEIYERPNSRFVADFVGAVNLFEGELVAGFNSLCLAVPGIDEMMPLPGLDLPAGTRLALAVRPEKLRLSRDRSDGFALSATLVSVAYEGAQSTLHLRLASGRPLRAYVPSEPALRIRAGESLWASWLWRDAVVLTE